MTRAPWIQTYSGVKFDLENTTPDMVEVIDIAHALANLCRYTGHAHRFYSVAQHCVLASREVPRDCALATLFHDAAEAYVSDLSAPLKRLPDLKGYREIEDRILSVVYAKVGIKTTPEQDAVVHEADIRMLLTEAQPKQGIVGPHPGIGTWEVPGKPYPIDINPWAPWFAKRMFMSRYAELTTIEKIAHWLTIEEIDSLGMPLEDEIGSTVIRYSTGFYWWDETMSHCYGPFLDKISAERSVCSYAESL